MSACVTYITCITQVTFKSINNTLLIYNWWLVSFTFSSCSIFRLTNTGWMVVWTLRLRCLSCFFTISAERWSLNGKITRIVSSVSWDVDKGCCWSQTFESTKLLMVELTRCLGYFNRENTVFKRLHSSEKCVQDEDKRCARSSIVLSKPFSHRLSTWLIV